MTVVGEAVRAPEGLADLTLLLAPRSIAVVGASEKGLGGNATRNLLEHSRFDGTVHLVSRRPEVFGRPTVASLDEIDGDVDVVLVAVPRGDVPGVLRQAQARHAAFAVVMTAGFAEAGDDEGRRLDAEIREVLAGGSLRMVGPNCPGVGDLSRPLGLTIQPGFPDELGAGSIGVVAQSGGLTRCILQAWHRGARFSAFFSPGNQTDLDIADFAGYLVDDPATRVIALAVEHFPSTARLAGVAERARAAGKPIVLLKTGASDAGRAAASSHTGAIVGSRAAAEASVRRMGIVLVEDVDRLVEVAAHLDRGRRATGPEALVFGMSGGSAVVVTDALDREGVGMASLGEATRARLREFVPPSVSLSNPLDLADASFGGTTFRDALRIAAADPAVGVVLVLFNAWYGTVSKVFADACREVAADSSTPIVPVWMSARSGPELDDLEAAGLFPCRSATGGAVVARALTEVARPVPAPVADAPPVDVHGLHDGVLLEDEGKDLLHRNGVRVPGERVVADYTAAVEAAAELGYPVIAKALHPAATHRAGTGLVTGVIRDEAELAANWTTLRAAVEVLPRPEQARVLVAEFVRGAVEGYVGLVRDPEWGPVLSLGLGGRWIEEFADASLVPLPAGRAEIEEAVGRSRLGRVLERTGTSDAARAAFVDAAWRIGALAAAAPEIAEIDVNPVILTDTAAVAVDALVRVG